MNDSTVVHPVFLCIPSICGIPIQLVVFAAGYDLPFITLTECLQFTFCLPLSMSDYDLGQLIPDDVMITPLCFLYVTLSRIWCVCFIRPPRREKDDKQFPI
jgi:hypothetical protein